MKYCSKCGYKLTKLNTSPLKHGFKGLASWCRLCSAENFRLNWNVYKWPAKLGKFNKSGKNNEPDGSINVDFLKYLYTLKYCYLCSRKLNKSRCLSYKIPLNKNGKHRSSNVMVVCQGCKLKSEVKRTT